jgi:hypothetical protein
MINLKNEPFHQIIMDIFRNVMIFKTFYPLNKLWLDRQILSIHSTVKKTMKQCETFIALIHLHKRIMSNKNFMSTRTYFSSIH